jgi:hypothetical protein
MSKVYYDHLIILEEVEIEVRNLPNEKEEKMELEHMIEEIIHHKVMERVLNHLPRQNHAEFLDKFTQKPFDHGLISYIDEKIEESIEKHISDEIGKLKKELLQDIKKHKAKS